MSRFPAKFILTFFKIFAKYYFKKTRFYRYKKIKVKVLPGVFFPHFTMSTKFLLQFIDAQNLTDKSLLELGCGTAIISVLAAKMGAKVTASDINPEAVKNALLNANKNKVMLNIISSDLFTNINEQQFDYIVINPPYYPKEPKNINEEAWFCGENFEYFEKLFSSINPFYNENTQIIMILSEDCMIDKIKEIALKNNLKFIKVLEQKKWREINYIFQLKSI